MYSDQRAVLTSKHQKLPLIAPHFQEHLNLDVVEVALDTDLLGTFSGEVPRTGTPLETAIAKARLGMAEANSLLGIASEGTIGPDPLVPFAISNIEVLVFIDDQLGLVVSETHRSLDIAHGSFTTTTGQDLQEFLTKVGFPNQGLIVRPGAGLPAVAKGITGEPELQEAISEALAASGLAHLECDYRAMHSPTRRLNISFAAKQLAQRIANHCAECNMPGWGKLSYERGLSCEGCGEFDGDAVTAELLGCVSCSHTELNRVISESLSPARCQSCNP